jgi:predicted nucleic acid-binding protein
MRTIISDSSCLISVHNSGDIGLLQKVFGEVTITPLIAEEFQMPLPSWITVHENRGTVPSVFQGIEIDPGEASAISLALELGDAVLIVDDLKARHVAKLLSIEFMGTLGVAVEAKRLGILPSIRPIIQRLRSVGLWFSEGVEARALAQANEV